VPRRTIILKEIVNESTVKALEKACSCFIQGKALVRRNAHERTSIETLDTLSMRRGRFFNVEVL
jgi:hypothetical protein